MPPVRFASVQNPAATPIVFDASKNASFPAAGAFPGGVTGTTATLTGAVAGASGAFTGSITGASAAISGALTAGSLSTNGSVAAATATVTGLLTAGSATVNGAVSANSAAVAGALTSNTVTIAGVMAAASANISGAANVQSATVSNQITAGSATVNGAVSANSVTVSGALAAANAVFSGSVSAANLGWLGVLGNTLAKDQPGRLPLIVNDDFLQSSPYYQNVGAAPGYYGATYYGIPGIGAGVVTLTTGTSMTGANNMACAYNFNPAKYTRVRSRLTFFLAQLSNTTDSFTASVGGFSTVGGAVQSSPMAALTYTDSVNGGRFQLATLGGSGIVLTDTGVTVAASKLYIFDFSLTVTAPGAGGNSLVWSITDAATLSSLASGTTTVNVVANAANVGGSSPLCAGIVKSLGTTACLLGLDSWQTVCLP